jgi:hypothetical protein
MACIVEVGTSSYYMALSEGAEEPVLKAICLKIAADEFRHYKLFYTHLKRYLERDGVGRLRRLMVALGRIHETEDDELAYAYYAANAPDEAYPRLNVLPVRRTHTNDRWYKREGARNQL